MALLADRQYLERLADLYQEADRLTMPVTRPTPLQWADANAIIRTADGRVLRFRDASQDRPYQRDLLADDSDRIIILKSRQIGISQTVAFVAAEEALAGGTVLWVSRNQEQAALTLDYVYTALSDCQHPPYVSENQQSFELSNGGKVITQPATRSAGRGIAATLVIIDEMAWQQYARLIYTAILPTLATTGGRLIVLSTPYGQGNLFHDLWEQAQQEGSPWSAHFLPWQVHPDWDEAWAEARRAEMGDEAFAQEHDCDFLRSGGAVFEQAEIDDLFRLAAFPAPDATHRYVSGFDIGRRQDAFVGVTLDVSTSPFQIAASDHALRLPYPTQADRIAARHALYAGRTIVESNGVGDPLIEFVTVPVEPFVTTALSKRNAITALKLLLQRRELVSPPIPQLRRELVAYQWDDKDITQDSVMALAIAALAAGRPVQSRKIRVYSGIG